MTPRRPIRRRVGSRRGEKRHAAEERERGDREAAQRDAERGTRPAVDEDRRADRCRRLTGRHGERLPEVALVGLLVAGGGVPLATATAGGLVYRETTCRAPLLVGGVVTAALSVDGGE